MNVSTSNKHSLIDLPPVLRAHVPEPPEHDPSVPPDIPPLQDPGKEVDLPPREDPDEVRDPQQPPQRDRPMRVGDNQSRH